MRSVRAGKTCLLSSVSNVLLGYDPRLTEEMLFLFGRGNRIDYQAAPPDGAPGFYIGHHSADIVETFFRHFEIPQQHRTGAAADGELLDEIRGSLARGNPVMIWVDMTRLGYLKFSPPPGSIHALTIEAEASGVLSLADCYAPLSLYSDKVGTHRCDIALGEFDAWKSTRYTRHFIEFGRLAERPLPLDAAAIRRGLVQAAHDYLHGDAGTRATGAVLETLALDLPRLLGDSAARDRLCHAFAYNIRYFGILWTREFLAAALARLARDERRPELQALADQFQAALRQWKFVMLAILKISLAHDWLAQTTRTAAKIQALVRREQALYHDLLRRLAS